MAKLPPVSTIEKLIRQGWTYADIGDEFGVQEMSVWRKLQRAGKVGNIETSKDYLPWEVESRHYSTAIYVNLRNLRRLELGEEIPERSEKLAKNMLKKLKASDAVVGYEPDFPPNPASEKLGGFFYAPRRKGDFEYLRNPKVTK